MPSLPCAFDLTGHITPGTNGRPHLGFRTDNTFYSRIPSIILNPSIGHDGAAAKGFSHATFTEPESMKGARATEADEHNAAGKCAAVISRENILLL